MPVKIKRAIKKLRVSRALRLARIIQYAGASNIADMLLADFPDVASYIFHVDATVLKQYPAHLAKYHRMRQSRIKPS
jgi:hypothetical protein